MNAFKEIFKRLLFWFFLIGACLAVWHWIIKGLKILARLLLVE